MKVITVCNVKGGIGKTTIALNIATGYANRGFKTLAIDLDAQANLTDQTGMKFNDGRTICECLEGKLKTKTCIHKTKFGFDLIPSKDALYSLAIGKTDIDEEGKLKTHLDKVINQIKDEYSIVVIDTNPGVTNLLVEAILNGLYGIILIPGKLDQSSLKGFSKILGFKEAFKVGTPFKYLINFYRGRVKEKAMLEKMRESIGPFMMKTIIRDDMNMQFATNNRKALINRPNTKGGSDLNELVEELIEMGVR